MLSFINIALRHLTSWISWSPPRHKLSVMLVMTHLIQSFETQPGGRPGPWVFPGSPGSTLFFYKSKWRCFDKKQKKIINGLQSTGSTWSHQVVTFPIFFKPGPVPAPDPWSTRGVGSGFKTMNSSHWCLHW
jgi:hypothetical protein